MKAYQLHDSETEEILGTVLVTKTNEDGTDDVHEAWEDFNKLEEHELDNEDIYHFVSWYNEGYVSQIEELELEFVQP